MKRREYCPTCNLPIPDKVLNVLIIPCSEYHVRCIRCGWPVAKNGARGQSMIDDDEICDMCKKRVDRLTEEQNDTDE